MAFYNELNNHTNFSISFTRTPVYDFGIFAKGYRLSANLIVDELLKGGRFSDYQAYPVVFLYRHALELHLKNIIYKGTRLSLSQNDLNIEVKPCKSHNLIPLSKNALDVVRGLFSDDQDLYEIMNEVVSTAKDLSEIDPDSHAYRYPINTKAQPSTERNQIVNLQALANHMNSLLSKLEVIDFGFDVEQDSLPNSRAFSLDMDC